MSYAVNKKCGSCAKTGCADGVILSKAVETIHSLPTSWSPTPNENSSVGHLGGGSIDLNCGNYKSKDQPAPQT